MNQTHLGVLTETTLYEYCHEGSKKKEKMVWAIQRPNLGLASAPKRNSLESPAVMLIHAGPYSPPSKTDCLSFGTVKQGPFGIHIHIFIPIVH